MRTFFTLFSTVFIFFSARAQYTATSCSSTMLISNGTFAVNGDDNYSGAITLPFTFTFYGTSYTQLFIGTNGFISFGNLDMLNRGCCRGYTLPNTVGQPYIGLAQADLIPTSITPGTNGCIYYSTVGTAPTRVFVVHYQAVIENGSGSGVTGEMQLFETTNEIRIISNSIDIIDNQATMGIAKGDGIASTVIAGRNSTFFTAGAEGWSLTDAVTLPLTLLNFSGVDNGSSGNILNWTTAGEVNTRSFEVERSNDGSKFEKLNSVTASGNSSATKEYTYNDVFTYSAGQVYFYRLKMIDQDGHYKYSPIVMMRKDNTGRIRVFPNPFTEKVVINLESVDKATIVLALADLNGKTILKQNESVKRGMNAIELKVSSTIPKGVYLLRVVTATKVEMVKIIKL